MTITTTGSSSGSGEQFVMVTTGALRGPPGPPGIQGPPGPGSASEEKTLAELGSTYLASAHPRTTVFVTDMNGAPVYSQGANWRSYSTNAVIAHDPITPASVLVSPKPLMLAPGVTQQMQAVVGPTGAPQSVTWTSSNPAVATVTSSGTVSVVSDATVGATASISAETANGVLDGAALTVVSGVILPTGVTLAPQGFIVAPGSTQQLTATVAPTNATNKAVTWSSSNEAIATVDAFGLVTGVGKGNVTITATAVASPVSGTSTGAVPDLLRSVAMWNNIPTDSVTSQSGFTRCYMPVLITTGSGDIKGLVPKYLGFKRRFDQNAVVNLSPMSVVEAAYELYSGGYTAPVRKNGSRTFVVPAGQMLDGDVIPPSAFGFSNTTGIPVGTRLWHKMIFDIPSGGNIAASVRLFYGQINVPGYFYGSGTTMPSVDTIGIAQPVGGSPEALAYPFGPLTCGYFVDPNTKAVCIDGDSIAAGQGDDNSFGNTGMGFPQRALGKFDVPMASVNIACPGIVAGLGLTDPMLAALMALGPDGYLVNAGTNNGNDPLAYTAAQTVSAIDAMIARYKGLSSTKAGAKAVVCKLLPRTYDPTPQGSTPEAYTTDATQQIYNQWAAGQFSEQVNALLVEPKYDGVIDQALARSSTTPTKWSGTNGRLTIDGTHLNGGGNGLLATPASVKLKSVWMS